MRQFDKSFTHPEVLKDVTQEFNRLSVRHPELDPSVLWDMARDYCFTVHLADSYLMRAEMYL